jgi:hypothetical protein
MIPRAFLTTLVFALPILVTMRKPGDNPDPVTHTNDSFPVAMWQRYASPIWVTTRGVDSEGFAICTGDDDGIRQ